MNNVTTPVSAPLRIAVWHNLPAGGAKRALYEHVRGLVAKGHHVEAWCPESAGNHTLKLDDFITEHRRPLQQHQRRGWHQLLPGQFGELRHYQEMEQHCQTCAAEIDQGGFDVLLACSCSAFAVSPIARYLKVPVVLYGQEPMRIHYEADLGDGDPGHPMSLRAKVRQRLDAFWRDVAVGHERHDARACARILVNSLFSRESFARAYGLDSHVCYLGINTNLFQPTHATREPFVMGLSTISLHKDLQIAVRAVATIPAPNRPALKWAGHIGDRRYQQDTETLACDLGVDFELLPGIDDANLIDHLNRATAMLFTSKLEPFGFAPLEANACGTPVVAIGEGGVRETVTDGLNGLVIANRDPIALGAAIQKLIDQPDLAERLGQNGLELIRSQWTWSKAVDDLENHLRDVAKQAR